MGYDLKKLSHRHHEIARLSVLGHSPEEIAETLNLHPATVRQLLNNSQLMKTKTSELTVRRDAAAVDIRRDFERMAPTALSTIETLVGNQDNNVPPAIQFRAAHYVLGVLGAVPVKQVKHQVITAALPQEDVKALIEQLKTNQSRASVS